MDLNAYLLNEVIVATTPPGETEANARFRREAIGEMFKAFDPRDGMEAMIASHCISLHFLLNAAMRDAGDVRQTPEILARRRAGALGLSKTLQQWMTKLEKIKQRKETRAAEAVKAARAPTVATPEAPVAKTGPGLAAVKQPQAPDRPIPDGAAPPLPVGAPPVRGNGLAAAVPR